MGSFPPPDRTVPARSSGTCRQAVRVVGLSLGRRSSRRGRFWALPALPSGLSCDCWAGEAFSGACAVLFHRARDRRHAVRRACRSVVSPSFGLTRPMRPRFGMSNRRPSSLRSVSLSRPQRPFSAFFPWPLRAHSSRDKKASPWPPSTALRPFGCSPIASGQRQPSRSRWSRPEKRKRIRTWLPLATSP